MMFVRKRTLIFLKFRIKITPNWSDSPGKTESNSPGSQAILSLMSASGRSRSSSRGSSLSGPKTITESILRIEYIFLDKNVSWLLSGRASRQRQVVSGEARWLLNKILESNLQLLALLGTKEIQTKVMRECRCLIYLRMLTRKFFCKKKWKPLFTARSLYREGQKDWSNCSTENILGIFP